ncbi:type II toxin-antitoxin system RelE/ParE family toxin [Mesorhizobium sp. B2-6-2]|uniref:type II toxin-antitoxin system RelE/ParE family toxin n=1 Tax=Mesorhizobium sp. B2-6-2 TaxID=2589915 RepID=UPI0032B20F95
MFAPIFMGFLPSIRAPTMIQRLEVQYRQSARDDLANIFRHIAEASGNPQVALKFVLRMEDRCQSIGNAPRGGRSRDDIVPGLRTVPFEHQLCCRKRCRSHHQRLLRRSRLRGVDARRWVRRPILKSDYSAGSAPALGNPGLPASPGFLRT